MNLHVERYQDALVGTELNLYGRISFEDIAPDWFSILCDDTIIGMVSSDQAKVVSSGEWTSTRIVKSWSRGLDEPNLAWTLSRETYDCEEVVYIFMI